MPSLPRHAFALGLAGLLQTSPATARPKIIAATPTANTAVVSPTRIELRFSERLLPRFSGADLNMVSMPGMQAHPVMKVDSMVKVAADGQTLVITPARRLASGGYSISWHAVSANTHRIEGKHDFRVSS